MKILQLLTNINIWSFGFLLIRKRALFIFNTLSILELINDALKRIVKNIADYGPEPICGAEGVCYTVNNREEQLLKLYIRVER